MTDAPILSTSESLEPCKDYYIGGVQMNIKDIKHIHIVDEQPLKPTTAPKRHRFSKHRNEKEPVSLHD